MIKKTHTYKIIPIIAVLIICLAFTAKIYYINQNLENKNKMSITNTSNKQQNSGLDIQYISKQILPGDDFYRYANEGWLTTKKIPDGFPALNSFHDVYIQTEDQVEIIINDLLSKPYDKLSSDEKKISDLYNSYIDIDKRNKQGLEPIEAELNKLIDIKDKQNLLKFMAIPWHQNLFSIYIDLDQKNPTNHIVYIRQGGLGLPNRDYYLLDKEDFKNKRKAYLEYIENILNLANIKNSAKYASDILAFETQIAQAHWPVEQTRDEVRNYNLKTIAELNDFAYGYEWSDFFEFYAKEHKINNIVVATDSAVKSIAKLYKKQKLDVLKHYMIFHYISDFADFLTEDIALLRFNFYEKTIQGIDKQRDIKKRAIERVNSLLGEPMGHLYVNKHFPTEVKQKILDYCEYFRATFKDRLTNNNWMDVKTKQEALKKLTSFQFKIGYPDKWRDYSSIETTDDNVINNIHNIVSWEQNDMLKKLGENKRDWEWHMPAQTINAYYEPERNEIVFPAAILQSPFYSNDADPAINFGAIGAVIGHEMGHGFDDQGSLYNSKGVLESWWTESSRDKFSTKTKVLVEQYSQYSPLDGMFVNGEFTLGENIGDLGGLTIAYNAYQDYIKDNYKNTAPVIDGFTGEQRFFLSWARVWRAIETKDYLRQRLLTDPHSPNQYRVNGVVRNMDSWYEAFNIQPSNTMYLNPDERVNIW